MDIEIAKNKFAGDRFAALAGIEILETGTGYCKARLIIEDKHRVLTSIFKVEIDEGIPIRIAGDGMPVIGPNTLIIHDFPEQFFVTESTNVICPEYG